MFLSGEHLVEVMDTVFDSVEVDDSRLDRRKVLRNRRGNRWLNEAWAQAIIGEGKAAMKRERDKMAAAAAVTVLIVRAGLSVALVGGAVDLAALFPAVGRRFVGDEIISVVIRMVIQLLILVCTVINLWSKCSWAEIAANELSALEATVMSHLATALTGTV